MEIVNRQSRVYVFAIDDLIVMAIARKESIILEKTHHA